MLSCIPLYYCLHLKLYTSTKSLYINIVLCKLINQRKYIFVFTFCIDDYDDHDSEDDGVDDDDVVVVNDNEDDDDYVRGSQHDHVDDCEMIFQVVDRV